MHFTKKRRLSEAISLALLFGAASLISGNVLAQDQNQQDQGNQEGAEAQTLEAVTVTGSRIKRAEIEGALPITVISREELEASGDISVTDFLRETTFNSFGSYQSTSGSSGSAPRRSACVAWARPAPWS